MNRLKFRISLKAVSIFTMIALIVLMFFCFSAQAGDPHSAYYSSKNNEIFWFIHITDIHIGTSGTQDSDNLAWIVNNAKSIIKPEFIVATGDLTDSTKGGFLPSGPYIEEWDQYNAILTEADIDESFYYDIPGNHDAYNDASFVFYINNSIQGKATQQTQVSWTREFSFGKYHFIGANTAGNDGRAFKLSFPYGDYAGLDSSELSFIETKLEEHSDAKLTLVFGHHAMDRSEGVFGDTWIFYGAPEFSNLMEFYGISSYGYGHTHQFTEKFFTQGEDYLTEQTYYLNPGIFYINIDSLGKSSNNHFNVTAIDCNGIATVTQAINTWPVVLITTPMDLYLGGVPNPYAYSVPNLTTNPIRTLVFDVNTVAQVQYRIDGIGNWNTMTQVSDNPYLWEGVWDASTLSGGKHTIEVQAESNSGTRTDLITVNIEGNSACNINGFCEEGEDCNNCPGDCISGGGGGICGNGVCEPIIGEDCLSCPSDCAGKQGGKPSKRFCCGDGDGENPVDCSDSRCTSGEFECGVPSQPYCCGDGTCEGEEDKCNCPYDCGQPPSTEEECADGIDNDCDGTTDCGDPDCDLDPACSCGAKKSLCTKDSQCCSNRCSNKGLCL